MADSVVISREALMALPKERLVDIILIQADTIARLEATVARLEKRIEELEARLNINSSNSNQPPSSDSPYKKPVGAPGKKGKPGAKRGHKGHRQQMLEPREIRPVAPAPCSCGCGSYGELKPFYTHQHLELPQIEVAVTHFVLLKGACTGCGKINKARVPSEYRSGYGPRMSAVIAELAGSHGDSRSTVQNFCASVLGVSISLGAIQKVLDRASEAIKPHYEAIGDQARRQAVNHADETSWQLKGALCWLWVLASTNVAYFMIHKNRSREAFKALVKDWAGILVSDGYRLYTDWVGLRQTCLAHLKREAKKLSESKNAEIAKFGTHAEAELGRLCHMAHAPPTIGEWRAFYARFVKLITRHHGRKDAAGTFAARLLREMDSLWLFLEKAGVSPTNNHAERMLRFAVCWRKRSYGNITEKGHRWAERILTLRQTCRLRSKRTFALLVEAIDSHFKEQKPDLIWISQSS
jgi:transposase